MLPHSSNTSSFPALQAQCNNKIWFTGCFRSMACIRLNTPKTCHNNISKIVYMTPQDSRAWWLMHTLQPRVTHVLCCSMESSNLWMHNPTIYRKFWIISEPCIHKIAHLNILFQTAFCYTCQSTLHLKLRRSASMNTHSTVVIIQLVLPFAGRS